MSLFQQVNTTLAAAKARVAEQAGKGQTTEFLDRAGRSIQTAIKRWNGYNWQWLVVQLTPDISVLANTDLYALPPDFKDVYTLRFTGGFARPMIAKERRYYDRVVWNQVSTFPLFYNLLFKGTGSSLQIMPVPNTTDTGRLLYYRKMAVPCKLTDALTTAATTSPTITTTTVGGFGGAS